jgi:hypothetical protein
LLFSWLFGRPRRHNRVILIFNRMVDAIHLKFWSFTLAVLGNRARARPIQWRGCRIPAKLTAGDRTFSSDTANKISLSPFLRLFSFIHSLSHFQFSASDTRWATHTSFPTSVRHPIIRKNRAIVLSFLLFMLFPVKFGSFSLADTVIRAFIPFLIEWHNPIRAAGASGASLDRRAGLF